jgi:predicted enzyme related to lactoylglutathione lyase
MVRPKLRKFRAAVAFALVSSAWLACSTSRGPALADTSPAPAAIGVGPQYNTSHVYVAPADLARFTASFVATFGGKATQPSVLTVTPTPSRATLQAALTPTGLISAFAFTTPIPFPFGAERTGYLVSDFDAAIAAARANGASIVVAPFNDPIGRDAIVEWPGGVFMQFYRHTNQTVAAPLVTVPENRVYLAADRADEFVRDFTAFAQGKVTSDDSKAPGIEIGRPAETYRRVRIESPFGKMTVLVTDGHLPYPYGRETTGYEVADLSVALAKAVASGATVLVAPYSSDGRNAAIVVFPGGYVAEIHSSATSPAR